MSVDYKTIIEFIQLWSTRYNFFGSWGQVKVFSEWAHSWTRTWALLGASREHLGSSPRAAWQLWSGTLRSWEMVAGKKIVWTSMHLMQFENRPWQRKQVWLVSWWFDIKSLRRISLSGIGIPTSASLRFPCSSCQAVGMCPFLRLGRMCNGSAWGRGLGEGEERP